MDTLTREGQGRRDEVVTVVKEFAPDFDREFVEKRWVPMGARRNPDDPDELYVAISTNDPDAGTLPRRKRPTG